MFRSELTAAGAAELVALDRILAGKPVDPSQLELAALVSSVRADAPTLGDDAVARLDERLARTPSRARDAHASPLGRLTSARPGATGESKYRRRRIAGGSILAAAALAAAVVAISGLTHATHQNLLATTVRGSSSTGAALPGPAAAGPALTPSPAPVPPSAATAQAGAGSGLQQKAAALTLGTRSSAIEHVAGEIVASTEQLGGIVENSNVTQQGGASLATFSLSVPSANLAALITTLSRLGAVQSLSQNTQDITDNYRRARSQLAASRRERNALFLALARATTANQTTSLQDRIDELNGGIGAQERAASALRSSGDTATLAVTIAPSVARTTGSRRPGTLRAALHDSLDVLQVMLAVALVALAALGPLTLVALVGYWLTRAWRRHVRERALSSR